MDKEGGGYFNTPGEDPSVLLRVKEDYDGAEPSGNSVAAINLVRLSSFFSDSRSGRYCQNAERLLVHFSVTLLSFGFLLAGFSFVNVGLPSSPCPGVMLVAQELALVGGQDLYHILTDPVRAHRLNKEDINRGLIFLTGKF